MRIGLGKCRLFPFARTIFLSWHIVQSTNVFVQLLLSFREVFTVFECSVSHNFFQQTLYTYFMSRTGHIARLFNFCQLYVYFCVMNLICYKNIAIRNSYSLNYRKRKITIVCTLFITISKFIYNMQLR